MSESKTSPLGECVARSLTRYFADMNGEEPRNLYGMVVSEIEKPLLRLVMEQVDRNQTQAARMLGINRNTLRKKLRHYGLE